MRHSIYEVKLWNLTFNDCHGEDVDDQSQEEVNLHLIQIFAVEHVREG